MRLSLPYSRNLAQLPRKLESSFYKYLQQYIIHFGSFNQSLTWYIVVARMKKCILRRHAAVL